MTPEITMKMDWVMVVESGGESTFLPANLFDLNHLSIDDFKNYCIEAVSFEVIEGHGARLSMPGYTDCTEWTVHDSEDEAMKYLEEQYGD
jgi:hypothetical protein